MATQKLLRSFGAGQSVRSNATQGADTFVQNNNKAGRNALHGLADAFGIGSKVMEAQTAYISEEARKEAITAFSKYGKEIGKAGREGKIAHFENPVFQSQLSKLKGNRASIAYNEYLREAYEGLPNKNKMRPEEFLEFEENARMEFIEAQQAQQFEEQQGKDDWDDDFVLAFQTGANQHVNNLGQSHAALQQQMLQDEHKELVYQQTLNTIREGIILPLESDGPIDVQANVASINQLVEDSYNSGLQGHHIREQVKDALISIASEHDNEAIVELAKGIKVGTTNLFDNSETRDEFVQAIKRGQKRQEELARKRELDAEKAKKEHLESVMDQATLRIMENPEDSLTDLAQANPSLYTSLEKLKTTANRPSKTNPNTLISLDQKLSNGTLTKAEVTQAFASGKLSQSDWSSLTGTLESRTQARQVAEQKAGKAFTKRQDAIVDEFKDLVKSTISPNAFKRDQKSLAAIEKQFGDNLETLITEGINNGTINSIVDLEEHSERFIKTLMSRHETLNQAQQTADQYSLPTLKLEDRAAHFSRKYDYSPELTEKVKGWTTGNLVIESEEQEKEFIEQYMTTQTSDIPMPIHIARMFTENGVNPNEREEVKAFFRAQKLQRDFNGGLE